MNRKFLVSILAVVMAIMMIVPAALAESVSADPFEEINAEFLAATRVEPYQVMVHPPRVTSWASLRWAPSNSALLMATYYAKQELTVLRETPNWLLVENKETGDIGYISKANVEAAGEAQVAKELSPVIESNGKTNIGVIDINGAFSIQCALAEGYTIEPIKSASDQLIAIVYSQDTEKPYLTLSVAFDENYASVDRMNDLDSDALAVLEKTFTDSDPTVDITYTDTGLGTRLMMVREKDGIEDYLDFLSIYKGYFVECVMAPSNSATDKTLTEDQVRMCIDFLTEMDFVPAGTINSAEALAGQTLITNLTDYKAEDNTVRATVMKSLPLPADQVEALKVGDKLVVGELNEEITSVDKTEEGYIMVNDMLELRKSGDEYRLFFFDVEYLEAEAVLTLSIPDTLTVEDYINQETGEVLEEPVKHTAEEFKAMLAADDYPDFATNNTKVTFGENGEMVSVVREYSPVQ